MTPDEIRARWTPGSDQEEYVAVTQAEVLQEIAAQQAETNQHLKAIADAMYADGMAKHGG